MFGATVVERVKLASLGAARPETPSEAVQRMPTLALCQLPSEDPHEMAGACLSMSKLSGPAVDVLSALSDTTLDPVEMSEPSPAAVRVNASSPGSFRPDSESRAEKWTVTSVVYQPLVPAVPSIVPWLMMGASLSMFTDGDTDATLPALSRALRLLNVVMPWPVAVSELGQPET